MEGCGNKIGPYDCCTIVTGDAKELAKAIPDESVDLIFTDPVYDRIKDYQWLAKTGARILRDDRAVLAWCATPYLLDTLLALSNSGLSYRWQAIVHITNEVKHRPSPFGKCAYKILLWFDKGKAKRHRFMFDIRQEVAFRQSSNYIWSKPIDSVCYYLDGLTEIDNLVVDFFSGGGVTPAASKLSARHYLAFEIDPEVAERARERVRNTQPPLFVMEPEQAEFAT